MHHTSGSIGIILVIGRIICNNLYLLRVARNPEFFHFDQFPARGPVGIQIGSSRSVAMERERKRRDRPTASWMEPCSAGHHNGSPSMHGSGTLHEAEATYVDACLSVGERPR
jgi:hypothetical protein